MIKNKLIYLAVVVAAGAFFILYRDLLSLILFLVILAVPLLLLLVVVLMRIGIRLRVESEQSIYSHGDNAKITLTVANYSVLPVSQIKVYVKYKNAFFAQYDVGEFQLFASPLSKNRYEIDLQSRHAGKVEVFFKKARVLDYLGLFSIPIRMKQTVSLLFLPAVHSLEPRLRKNNYAASEATVYSKHKPGDDPTEVFAIREYADGDKLSRIHWKLTSKQDKYMVKDYSLPINESVLLLPELMFGAGGEADLDRIDAVLEVVFSLSHAFVERKTLHSIGYYHAAADKVLTLPINSLDDLYAAFGEIFNSSTYYSRPILAGMDPEQQSGMSHVVYVCGDLTDAQCAALSAGKSDAVLYSIIHVMDEGASDGAAAVDGANVISVKQSRIVACLNDADL